MNTRELSLYLCDRPAEISDTLSAWIADSRRFQNFADKNRAKIRKKIRTARGPDALASVMLELEVARHFVLDSRCDVTYEKYGQGVRRSPDLTLCFRARADINLEVTLVRSVGPRPSSWDGKFNGIICSKLGQMIPDCANVLMVAADESDLTVADVAQDMKGLKQAVERRDPAFCRRTGYTEPAEFFREFQWLSALALWQHDIRPGQRFALWQNPSAKRVLPPDFASLALM
jgi:hypothetical protein